MFENLLKDWENSDYFKIHNAHDTIMKMNELDRKMTHEECEDYMKALNTIAHYLCNGYVLMDIERASRFMKEDREKAKELLNELFGGNKDND